MSKELNEILKNAGVKKQVNEAIEHQDAIKVEMAIMDMVMRDWNISFRDYELIPSAGSIGRGAYSDAHQFQFKLRPKDPNKEGLELSVTAKIEVTPGKTAIGL